MKDLGKSKYRIVWNKHGFDRAEYVAEWFDGTIWSPCCGKVRKTQFEAQSDCVAFSIPSGAVEISKIEVV